MGIVAKGRFLRCSPRKARLVLDAIRGMDVETSLAVLRYSTRRASKLIENILKSAVANAEENHGVRNPEGYLVSGGFVDAGPTMKRIRPATQGRANRVRKRTCHITLEIDRPGGNE